MIRGANKFISQEKNFGNLRKMHAFSGDPRIGGIFCPAVFATATGAVFDGGRREKCRDYACEENP